MEKVFSFITSYISYDSFVYEYLIQEAVHELDKKTLPR